MLRTTKLSYLEETKKLIYSSENRYRKTKSSIFIVLCKLYIKIPNVTKFSTAVVPGDKQRRNDRIFQPLELS